LWDLAQSLLAISQSTQSPKWNGPILVAFHLQSDGSTLPALRGAKDFMDEI
jgi:hypothetical protein